MTLLPANNNTFGCCNAHSSRCRAFCYFTFPTISMGDSPRHSNKQCKRRSLTKWQIFRCLHTYTDLYRYIYICASKTLWPNRSTYNNRQIRSRNKECVLSEYYSVLGGCCCCCYLCVQKNMHREIPWLSAFM